MKVCRSLQIAWQSNSNSLPSSERRFDSGARRWEKSLSEWTRRQEAIVGIHFTKKWRAETLQLRLESDNFKPRLESGIFKCIFWLNGSLLGVMIGVRWTWKSGLIKWHQATNVTSQLANCSSLFTSIVHAKLQEAQLLWYTHHACVPGLRKRCYHRWGLRRSVAATAAGSKWHGLVGLVTSPSTTGRECRFTLGIVRYFFFRTQSIFRDRLPTCTSQENS